MLDSKNELMHSATIDDVVAVVSDRTGIRRAIIINGPRHPKTVWARQVAMWCAYNVVGASYPEIGRYFSRRHHTTVMGACKKVSSRLRSDNEFADELGVICQAIDPKHRILETTYQFVFEGDLEDFVEEARRLVDRAKQKDIKTIVAKVTLLRGTPPAGPWVPSERNASKQSST